MSLTRAMFQVACTVSAGVGFGYFIARGNATYAGIYGVCLGVNILIDVYRLAVTD